ncbi:MAG: cell division protein SepF [Clostridia bacterium]|nr:cell division protein SepF [Clostridia bacterium]
MGLFDFMGRDSRAKSEQKARDSYTPSQNVNANTENNSQPLSVFKPSSLEEVSKIIDALKNGKNAVVHLEGLRAETQIRIIDFLSGAVYTLEGGVYEMSKDVYMFSPSGVEIK